jgi:hypothetical protein
MADFADHGTAAGLDHLAEIAGHLMTVAARMAVEDATDVLPPKSPYGPDWSFENPNADGVARATEMMRSRPC